MQKKKSPDYRLILQDIKKPLKKKMEKLISILQNYKEIKMSMKPEEMIVLIKMLGMRQILMKGKYSISSLR